MYRYVLLTLLTCTVLLASGCEKKEAAKPADKGINITTAKVIKRDMPATESAVGTLTSISMAQALDPTRMRNNAATVRLPFPAHITRQLRIGQDITLSSFDAPDTRVRGQIREIRPALNTTTDSLEVIVEVMDTRNWRPTGSIRGEVITAVNKGVLVVPEQALAIRPAGTVVYTVENGVVRANTVTSGLSRDGLVEITRGLTEGALVAVDGASLLTDGARVNVRDAQAGGAQDQARP